MGLLGRITQTQTEGTQTTTLQSGATSLPYWNRRESLGYGYSHAPGCALDDACGMFDVAGIEVGQFLLGDLQDLLLGQIEALILATFLGIRRDHFLPLLLPGRDFGGKLDENGCRRAFDFELKAPIRIDRNDDRQHQSLHFRRVGLVVELLDEHADIDAVGTQGRPYRRGRSCRSARTLEFDVSCNLLGHESP